MVDQRVFVVGAEPHDARRLYDRWNAGIEDALACGAEWIFFEEPGVHINANAISAAAPALCAYDAVWGGMTVDGVISEKSTFTCDDFINACHMALVWWVGRSHFVRTAVVSDLRFGSQEGWYGDYLLRIWQHRNCLKTAQAFVDGEDELPSLSEDDLKVIIDFLKTNPLFISFNYEGHQIKLPYTGINPTLERTQLRGVFFEQRDLKALAGVIRPGATIVDVGANTGNHLMFFAHVLKAGKIIPLEPNPDTIRFLKSSITENGLDNVDMSKLGVGAGETRDTLYLHTGRRGHLGTARLEPHGRVAVEVWPLDELISEPIDFIKIDVENMEIEVLKGARKLFAGCRPTALVEVQDDNITAFLAILDELGYRINRIFADHGYANYLIAPEEFR